MNGPFANRLFRSVFVTAGAYNIAFGLWAVDWPMAFFNAFDLAPPRYPGIWACLGMVVSVYGLLYWYAAWRLEAAWPIIAVGLLGKVLGPIGMILSFSDEWPRRLGMLCVYDDLIWWLPFALFLVRGTGFAKWLERVAPWCCLAAHVLALAMLGVYLRHGALTEPDVHTRSEYITKHVTSWSLGWGTWMLAAATLVGFYAWWGSRLTARNVAFVAVAITWIGAIFDFSGESLASLLLVERAAAASQDAAPFIAAERAFAWCSAGAANGLYTFAGILLTLATPGLPRWVRALMWITWIAGAAMTIAAILNFVWGLVASTAVLFPPLIVWIGWMGARWRRT